MEDRDREYGSDMGDEASPGAAQRLVRIDGPAGDAACWLERVCPECGAIDDGPTAAACWRCGAVREAES